LAASQCEQIQDTVLEHETSWPSDPGE